MLHRSQSRVSQRSKLQQRRPLRHLAVLLASCGLLATGLLSLLGRRPASHTGLEAFATLTAPVVRATVQAEWERPLAAARTAVLDPDTRQKVETEEEVDEEDDVKGKKNSTTMNFTLQLGDGFPDDSDSAVDMGPPYVKCHVMYADRSGRDEHGSVMPRTVLEEWVMKGTSEHVSAFKSWRQQTVGQEMDTRCSPISRESLEEVQCLACVPRNSGALPLTPTGQLHASQPGTITNTYVLTIRGVDQCLAGSFGGSSFCKSGSVAVTM